MNAAMICANTKQIILTSIYGKEKFRISVDIELITNSLKLSINPGIKPK